MKKISLTSLGVFAVAMVIFSGNMSHANENWKICGDCHRCTDTAESSMESLFVCYEEGNYASKSECQEAAQKINWKTGSKKPC